jgi:hypothetical protein
MELQTRNRDRAGRFRPVGYVDPEVKNRESARVKKGELDAIYAKLCRRLGKGLTMEIVGSRPSKFFGGVIVGLAYARGRKVGDFESLFKLLLSATEKEKELADLWQEFCKLVDRTH